MSWIKHRCDAFPALLCGILVFFSIVASCHGSAQMAMDQSLPKSGKDVSLATQEQYKSAMMDLKDEESRVIIKIKKTQDNIHENQKIYEKYQNKQAKIRALLELFTTLGSKDLKAVMASPVFLEELKVNLTRQQEQEDSMRIQSEFLRQTVEMETERLKRIQASLQNPTLARLLLTRIESITNQMDSGETSSALEHIAEYVSITRDDIENVVARRLFGDSSAASIFAGFLAFVTLAAPLLFIGLAVFRLRRHLSFGHIVLLIDIGFLLLILAFSLIGLVTRHEPMQALRELHHNRFILFQLLLGLSYPIVLGIQLAGFVKEKEHSSSRKFFFGHITIYMILAIHYRSKVWKEVLIQEPLELSSVFYILYLLVFLSLSAAGILYVFERHQIKAALDRLVEVITNGKSEHSV